MADIDVSIDPVQHNRDAWDRLVEQGDEWTLPVTSEVIARAQAGDWFTASLAGVDLLALASGGSRRRCSRRLARG